MNFLTPIDWYIIIFYIILVIGIGVYLSRRATKNIESYFIADRKLPWWLLGTSIVATTFAADTPLVVSGLIKTKGIAGNWYWWSAAMGGMLGVFFYSHLWRRSRIITDAQFAELRYSGKSASVLRGFRAIFYPLIYNTIVIGWVILAMTKILGGVLGLHKWEAVAVCFLIAVIYTSFGGLWGVVVTDLVEFCTAMFTSILLAIIAINKTGGMSSILEKLNTIYGDKASQITNIFPLESALMPIGFFFIYIGFQWWTSGNTDGGAYFSQRMLSAKDEKHARLGFLWANFAHYCIRTWPWIIVGIVAIVIFPDLKDPEMGYIKVMTKYLPAGLLGLALTGFLAAFLSTIDTQLNWGASYLINDLYKRFLVKSASDKHYVIASVIATIIIAVIGSIVTFIMTSIYNAWTIITSITAGIGIVYLLRWYWWRINAWSEISALISSLLMSAYLTLYTNIQFPITLLYITPVSVVCWLIVTFITPPSGNEKLIDFYKKVRPGGPGWNRIRKQIPGTENDIVGLVKVKGFIAAVIAIYSTLIGVGKLIFGEIVFGIILITVAAVMGVYIYNILIKIEKESLD
jgi:SSS family solute:Na+ symporter